jgi:hypothetical protein
MGSNYLVLRIHTDFQMFHPPPKQSPDLERSFFLCLLRGFDAGNEASGVGISTKDSSPPSSSSLAKLE